MSELKKIDKKLIKEAKVQASNVIINKGNLADGLNNVAEYLGLEPSKSIFMNSTIVNDQNLHRRISHKPIFSHSQVLAYLPRKKHNSSKGICLYVNKELLQYFNSVGIAPIENLVYLSDIPKEFDYPYISVAAQLKKVLKKDKVLRNKLKGYNIISSYLSDDEVEIARLINGKLIMDPNKQIQFNSKFFLRKNANLGNYSIPLGVYFNGINSLDIMIKDFKKLLFKNMIDSRKAKIWCKFESQSNGDGSYLINGLNDANIRKLKEHIFNFSTKLEYDEYRIKYEIPLVIEIDVSSLPYEKEIANIGVEAVIADNKITFVGNSLQITNNGKYIGSIIDNKMEKLSQYAEETALPIFLNMKDQGYRGFITMDVLLTFHSKTHLIKGYNIDPNARFTDGTNLLSLLHYSQQQSGKKMLGFTYSNSIRDEGNLFENVKEYAGEYLYEGEKSRYEGIIPIILNDLSTLSDGKRYLKTVVVSEKMDNAKEMYMQFKRNIIKHVNEK